MTVHSDRAPDWREDAACRHMPSDLWFPANDTEPHSPTRPADRAAAVSVCRVCPVRAECLADVMHHEGNGPRFGIWAGLTPKQRYGLHRGVPWVERSHAPASRTKDNEKRAS